MKIAEVVDKAAQPIVVQPSAMQRQARINKIVQKMAMDDFQNAQTSEPTEDEMFFARKIFKQQKEKADADYAKQQQQQATNSAIAANTVANTVSPSKVVKRQKR